MPERVSNPPNPWESTSVEWLGPAPEARLEVFEERAKSLLTKNDSPDIPFRWGANPYRGCQHACAYCYARPTHQYLGFGAGTDFDKKIVVKRNAAELLRRELARCSWRGEAITFSGVTDCYQPLEASYELMRRCLEVCLERANPVAIITKSSLVLRDVELLLAIERAAGARVYLSIPFADPHLARAVEPGAPTPSQRFRALRGLSEAGIPVGISISPLIPGLNDSEIPSLLQRAREAGASRAFMTLLRLPGETRSVFRARLEERLPGRAGRVLSGLADMRRDQVKSAEFGARMRGEGARWEVAARLFELHKRRLGFDLHGDEEVGTLGRSGPDLPESRAERTESSHGPSQRLLFEELEQPPARKRP